MSEELKSGLEEINETELSGVEASGGNMIVIRGYKYQIILPRNKSCNLFATGLNPYVGKYATHRYCGGCANLDKHAGFWYCKASKTKV